MGFSVLLHFDSLSQIKLPTATVATIQFMFKPQMLHLTAWTLSAMILWLGASENNTTALVNIIMKKEAEMKINGTNTSIFLWKSGKFINKAYLTPVEEGGVRICACIKTIIICQYSYAPLKRRKIHLTMQSFVVQLSSATWHTGSVSVASPDCFVLLSLSYLQLNTSLQWPREYIHVWIWIHKDLITHLWWKDLLWDIT